MKRKRYFFIRYAYPQSIVLLAAFYWLALGCRARNPSKPTATPEYRKVIGASAAYTDPLSISENASVTERRRYAWQVVEKLLKPMPIGKNAFEDGFKPEDEATLPLWQTFYDSSEFKEIFDMLYGGLTAQERQSKKSICPQDLKEIFNKHSKKSILGFNTALLEQRLGQLRNKEDIHGISGTGLALFSPATLAHLFQNYRKQIECAQNPVSVDGNIPPSSRSNHMACAQSEFPDGRNPIGDWDSEEYTHCRSRAGWEEAKNWTGMNLGTAVSIKTSWSRVTNADTVGIFPSDAGSLEQSLKTGNWTMTGLKKSSELNPNNIYTIRLQPSGAMYRLEALHIVTKELRHWSWITLWWADDPDNDFGEDRPSGITGPWENYKMCVVTDYEEKQDDPVRELRFAGYYPSLAASLDTAQKYTGKHTWCSNPFIERNADRTTGNTRSNCIGCHQHAGTNVDPDSVYLGDQGPTDGQTRALLFPNGGRSNLRQNFPSDYMWAVTFNPETLQDVISTQAHNADLNDLTNSDPVEE